MIGVKKNLRFPERDFSDSLVFMDYILCSVINACVSSSVGSAGIAPRFVTHRDATAFANEMSFSISSFVKLSGFSLRVRR